VGDKQYSEVPTTEKTLTMSKMLLEKYKKYVWSIDCTCMVESSCIAEEVSSLEQLRDVREGGAHPDVDQREAAVAALPDLARLKAGVEGMIAPASDPRSPGPGGRQAGLANNADNL
jgi:hypothetical protein